MHLTFFSLSRNSANGEPSPFSNVLVGCCCPRTKDSDRTKNSPSDKREKIYTELRTSRWLRADCVLFAGSAPMHYDAFAGAAAPPPALDASPEPEPEPKWTRRDDKFLELLCFTRNTVDFHKGASIIGKTEEQMNQRCAFLFAELSHVLESLEVSTPPVWDMETAVMPATPAAEEVVPGAVVPAAPPVAAVESSAARAVGAGGSARKRKKKKAEKWTDYEHRYVHRLLLTSKTSLPKSSA